MADKNQEVSGLDASLMKNVWEIRTRDFGQKLKNEEKRLEKSALGKINQDWQLRMSHKNVNQRKPPRKVKPPEETSPFQSYGSKQMAFGANRISGFQSSRTLGVTKNLSKVMKGDKKGNRLLLLLSLNERSPAMLTWTKSWKFAQILPALEEGKEASTASDWGKSWKLFNLQPSIEGKSWTEHDSENDIESEGILFLWEKSDRSLESQKLLQSSPTSEWEKSWQYTKPNFKEKKESHKDTANEPMDAHGGILSSNRFYLLHKSDEQNKENLTVEWNESWKTTKPPAEGQEPSDSSQPMEDAQDIQIHEEQSKSLWDDSWKYFKKQFHIKQKSTTVSCPPGWGEAWRLSKPVVQAGPAGSHRSEQSLYDMPSDPKTFEVIATISREMKQMLYQSYDNSSEAPELDWNDSWMTIKNLLKPSDDEGKESEEAPMEEPKLAEPVTEEIRGAEEPVAKDMSEIPAPTVVSRMEKYSKLLQPVIIHDMPNEWDDSWKSSYLKTKNQEGLEHSSPALVTHGQKSSWTSILLSKSQLTEERTRRSLQRALSLRQTEWTEASHIEWSESWRFTNLTLNQDDNLWQEDWTTQAPIRPQRWEADTAHMNAEVPNNGPTGRGGGWNEAWRFSRQQHHGDGEAALPSVPQSARPGDTQGHSRRSLISGWRDSWRFSTNQSHSDSPSETEWSESWRFLGGRQPRHDSYEKSMELHARKQLHRPETIRFSRSFNTQVFEERYPLSEWNESFKVANLRRHHNGQLGGEDNKESLQDWRESWKFEIMGHHSNISHLTEDVAQVHKESRLVHGKADSEWGKSWRISNAQPKQKNGGWLNAKSNSECPKDMVLLRKGYQRHVFSGLNQESTTTRLWGKSWMFMKMESKHDSKSGKSKHHKHHDDAVIMTKRFKNKKDIYSNIDKEKPSERRWVDACKLAKTQPRPKRESMLKSKMGKKDGEKGMFAEWAESWRFSEKSLNHKTGNLTVSVSEWNESWKFLLGIHPPENIPKAKGR